MAHHHAANAIGLVGVLLVLAASAGAQPRCFGASARDPEHPCTSTVTAVTPTPEDALLQPSALCVPTPSPPIDGCVSGNPTAKTTVVLLGDSHSVHWRAALDPVARARGWRVFSIYRSNCPYTTAYSAYGEPMDAQCTQFKRDVSAWFAAHPEVATVFVSANSTAAVFTPPGADRFANKVAGYAAAWQALPASVTRIYVLRDVFHQRVSTPACVERHPERCAIPRSTALPPDPEEEAARTVPRATLLDLTPLMCDERNCFPVVGGALVHKDRGHMTRTFAATLAPYLQRALNRT